MSEQPIWIKPRRYSRNSNKPLISITHHTSWGKGKNPRITVNLNAAALLALNASVGDRLLLGFTEKSILLRVGEGTIIHKQGKASGRINTRSVVNFPIPAGEAYYAEEIIRLDVNLFELKLQDKRPSP